MATVTPMMVELRVLNGAKFRIWHYRGCHVLYIASGRTQIAQERFLRAREG